VINARLVQSCISVFSILASQESCRFSVGNIANVLSAASECRMQSWPPQREWSYDCGAQWRTGYQNWQRQRRLTSLCQYKQGSFVTGVLNAVSAAAGHWSEGSLVAIEPQVGFG